LLQGWTESSLGSLIGLDDHGFHRGDGVFEALRVVNGKPYLLKPHLDRMKLSAERIGIKLPPDFANLPFILEAGLQNWSEAQAMVRLFVTRGPGGFSTNPQECLGSQLYALIMPFKSLPAEKFQNGVRIGRSRIQVKEGWMAITKSLNYLPNVMMKKESLERGLDFTVSFDDSGSLAESSTENIVVLTRDGHLAHPHLSKILKGCTMSRLFDLVEKSGILHLHREVRITEADLKLAQGVMMVGTTLDVLPVCEYEGQAIPISPWSAKLLKLIRDDQASS
jgi:branched-chain amino acid aminotransferase